MIKKIIRMTACFSLLTLSVAFFGCPVANQKEVMETRFPACFEEPMIGARSGARCEYVESAGEWRITFWHGWGDCPAGCINKEDSAWYKVDRRGRVFECDKDFNPIKELGPDDPIATGSMTNPPQKNKAIFIGEPAETP